MAAYPAGTFTIIAQTGKTAFCWKEAASERLTDITPYS
jgi:hypothetical protein